MKPDEKLLIDRVLAEEEGAFNDFLTRYRALIYSVLYKRGFGFPNDYLDDIFQSFVLAVAKDNFRKLRAFQGRNNCSLATFLQVVTTRFALDELRKWKRHPRGRGQVSDGDEATLQIEDPRGNTPLLENLDSERIDLFHNLLFDLEWKRISVVLWVFQGISRETIADVMATSRANIDALYKRAKDQMAQAFADGEYSRDRREVDDRVLVTDVRRALRGLVGTPRQELHSGLLQPGVKERAVIGLILSNYSHFKCSSEELQRMSKGSQMPDLLHSVLADLAGELC
ncbi:MAG: RNA polymerase sigma factor (sigma-70 family) [Pseudohongiellaceae bacterium]|jgi:RNA polymerase sigma factor (sigma-70 family)